MKVIKKIFLISLIVIILACLILYGYLLQTKPIYEGKISLKNLSAKTKVYYDAYGIPHIYANTETDAIKVMGYVHAQDRLWQMELLRRIAPGKLSEIFGSKTLKTDTFFATLDIDSNSEILVTSQDKNAKSYLLAKAYLDGVNEYIKNGKTPVEFTLLGIEKKPFTLKDIYNTFGYMAFSFAMAHKTDPLLTDLQNDLGSKYLNELGIDGRYNITKIKDYKENINYKEISKTIASILEPLPIPQFIGSNAWVIGGEKTKSGKVIFANDPHIGFSQPGTWYETHIYCNDYEIYGYYLPGTPFPLLGHNRSYAYGLTMFENDDVDFFEEEVSTKDKNYYFYRDTLLKFQTKQKTIKVKDSSSITISLFASKNGPIINNVIEGYSSKNPIAMNWVYLQEYNPTLEAVYQLSHAKNFEEFKKGISLIAAPGLNVMYGDIHNNIGWVASGKLYQYPKEINTNFITSANNKKLAEKKYIPFSKNPSSINPPWHYVYSSNNAPEPIEGYEYPGYYLPEDRALRIDYLLKSKNNWEVEDVKKMIFDDTNATVCKVISNVSQFIKPKNNLEKEAFTILKKWKGNYALEEIAPTIMTKFYFNYLEATFKDEMNEERFSLFMGTHIMKQVLTKQILNEESIWWDNCNTKSKKETKKDILQAAFQKTITQLEQQFGKDLSSWKWKRVHTVTYNHPFGQNKLLATLFNVGPFESTGCTEVINNMKFSMNKDGIYPVIAGPSTRRIIDFSNIENSYSILPTGQSGNPMSKNYSNQANMFIEGKFRKMLLNKKEIIKQSTLVEFIPN